MDNDQPIATPTKKKVHWKTKVIFTALLTFLFGLPALFVSILQLQKASSTAQNIDTSSQPVSTPAEPLQKGTIINHEPVPPTSGHSSAPQAAPMSASYINSEQAKKEISVTILDDTGNLSPSLSEAIAEIYGANEGRTTSNLLQGNIVHTSYLKELEQGNSATIDRLNLSSYADYLIIGRLLLSPAERGNTPSFSARMKLTIVHTPSYSVRASKDFPAYGFGFDEEQAKETAIQNLLSLIKQNHPIIE